MRPDLDQIEALTSEREALWARIEKVSFLPLNEKRAAVGYAPLEDPPPGPATENETPLVIQKYRPDQARAPAGRRSKGKRTAVGLDLAEANVADIHSRLKARETPQARFCWQCRKPLHARSDRCPFCNEKQ